VDAYKRAVTELRQVAARFPKSVIIPGTFMVKTYLQRDACTMVQNVAPIISGPDKRSWEYFKQNGYIELPNEPYAHLDDMASARQRAHAYYFEWHRSESRAALNRTKEERYVFMRGTRPGKFDLATETVTPFQLGLEICRDHGVGQLAADVGQGRSVDLHAIVSATVPVITQYTRALTNGYVVHCSIQRYQTAAPDCQASAVYRDLRQAGGRFVRIEGAERPDCPGEFWDLAMGTPTEHVRQALFDYTGFHVAQTPESRAAVPVLKRVSDVANPTFQDQKLAAQAALWYLGYQGIPKPQDATAQLKPHSKLYRLLDIQMPGSASGAWIV
jgi:hypothetical protein